MTDRVTIDGSEGEGGGQILRTALAVSVVASRPFRIENIRTRRRKPGLLRQHLTAVQAVAEVSGTRVTGEEPGSPALSFQPSAIRGGDYRWTIEGRQRPLVLQAVLAGLLGPREPSRLTIEGGTHNPNAPPVDFLATTFLPVLRRMGASVDVALEDRGFYPAGGGRFIVAIEPSPLPPLAPLGRGDARARCWRRCPRPSRSAS
jgi:RNA 3'-terminal phosphate cyclase (ATP)